jgi:methionine aminotransferase
MINNRAAPKVNIFSRMTRLATEHNAINLAQGFPDFPCDENLLACAEAALRGPNHQYAPVAGLLTLRAAIAEKIFDTLHVNVDAENQITITAGAAQAIFTAISSVLKAGDEAIVIEPAYDSYIPAIVAAGGVPKIISLRAPEFDIDWQSVDSAISKRTKLIIINNPNNPTGRIFSDEDFDELERLVEKHDLVVLSDEVYEHITFDGAIHRSVLSRPVLADRSLAVFSFGKTLHVTGWKIGYCIGPENLTNDFRNIQQYAIFSVNTPAQAAIANYLPQHGNVWRLAELFEGKRDKLAVGLNNRGFLVTKSTGTYFQLADYSKINKRLNEFEFAEWLTVNKGVASIPLSSFYSTPQDTTFVRFCFAKADATLDEAISRIST